MKILVLLFLTTICISTRGQKIEGKYHNYFGETLILNKDSTFKFDWRFDQMYVWASGKWTISGQTIHLKFIDIYDTLSRPNKLDTLVLSNDETSGKITESEYAMALLVSGGHSRDRFNDKFYKRGKRLYMVDTNGNLNKNRHRRILPDKTWPWGYRYKKWPTYFRKVS